MVLSLSLTTQRQAAVGYNWLVPSTTQQGLQLKKPFDILTCCLVKPVSAVISLISSSCSCSWERELPISRKLRRAGRVKFYLSKKEPEREVGEGEVGDGEGEGGHEGIWNWTGSPGRVLP